MVLELPRKKPIFHGLSVTVRPNGFKGEGCNRSFISDL